MEDIKHVAERWLKDFAFSAVAESVDKHLNMVSHRLEVLGVGERGFMDYGEWAERRRNDKQKGRLLRLSYKNVEPKRCGGGCVSFRVEETIKGTRGELFVVNKDVTLEREPDGVWRAVQEIIHHVTCGIASDQD